MRVVGTIKRAPFGWHVHVETNTIKCDATHTDFSVALVDAFSIITEVLNRKEK